MVKKCFKFIPRAQDKAVCILFSFILVLTEANLVLEEGYGKKNLVNPSRSNNGKIVFTLLTEVVILYVGLFIIQVWGTGFQEFIPKLLGGGRTSNLQNGLKNPLQVFFSELRDIKYSSRDNSNRKVRVLGSSGLVNNSSLNSRGGKKSRRVIERFFL